MKRIAAIGACVLDTLIYCPVYPTEDTKNKADSVIKTGGGPVSNALVAAAKLGAAAEYLGAIPVGKDGDFLEAELSNYGVETGHIRRVGNRVFTSYILLSQTSGSRTCVFERGNVPDLKENIDFTALRKADILHLDGNYLNGALAAAKFAKSNGITVSLDAGGLYKGIEDLVPYCDVLIPSEEWAIGFTGERTAEDAMIRLYKAYSPKVLVITQGARGGVYFDGKKPTRFSAFNVNCKDSNGAGDVFHGAFLAYHSDGLAVSECCKRASAVAAMKCMSVGIHNILPDKSDVNKFLKEVNKYVGL